MYRFPVEKKGRTADARQVSKIKTQKNLQKWAIQDSNL